MSKRKVSDEIATDASEALKPALPVLWRVPPSL